MTPAALACALMLALTLFGEGNDHALSKVVGKLGASTAFVGHAVLQGVPEASPHGTAVMAALALSWLGDMLLLSQARKIFLAGIGAFGLAHVAYVVAFVQLGPSWEGTAAGGALLALVAWQVWRWLGAHTGSLKGPVVGYIVVITAMVATAIGLVGAGLSMGWLGGAILFFVSDLFVARQRFVAPAPVNRYIGLPLYYAAQLVFGTVAGGG